MQLSNFLQKCIGIALVSGTILFGSAALIGTINPAKADNPGTINETGKIMMDQNSFIHNSNYYYHILVWDTETGKSKLYNYKASSGTISTTTYQLPGYPLY
jgi:hypothetical protein